MGTLLGRFNRLMAAVDALRENCEYLHSRCHEYYCNHVNQEEVNRVEDIKRDNLFTRFWRVLLQKKRCSLSHSRNC